jgi:hypothetical protein|tara:strand:- start:2804 stop:3226 length:423 start_codon:yes stop_codon:yes gene_type:complete
MSNPFPSVGNHSTSKNEVISMIKSALAAIAATPLLAGAALAGPYVNVEANSGFTGSDYNSTVTDFHVGYEGPVGDNAGYYVQAGPALVSVDGAETDTELSGKAGIGVDVSENVNVYGEVSFITADDDNGYGTKFGVKYTF